MILGRPKTIALDSAHYADLARDANSSESSKIRKARAFQETLVRSGYVPLITLHHIAELVKHRNKEVVRQSIELLSRLPAAAWIPNYPNARIAGAITDVLAIEASASLDIDNPSALEVRSAAKPKMIEFGTGEELVRPYLENWQSLQPHLWEREAKAREIMALSNSNIIKQFGIKMSDIKRAALRTPQEARPFFSAINNFLVQDIQRFGDRKMIDPTQTVHSFLNTIREETSNLGPGKKAKLDTFLASHELDRNDILKMKTPDEIGELSVFRKQLKIISERLGQDWPVLRARVQPNSIPSWIIQNQLRRHRDKSLVRSGSELSDRHLACLAAYADITLVDKRTHENLLRAKKHSHEMSTLIGQTEKASSYAVALRYLE